MPKNRRIRLHRGLGFKMILYIFLSVMAIYLLSFYYTLKITRNIVVKNLKINAESITTSTVSRIDKILSSVQRIPDNFVQIFGTEQMEDAEICRLLRMMVENNPEVTGACLAWEPFRKHPDKKYYAPYFYRKNGELLQAILGNDQYDYFTLDWYQIPKMLEKPVWSEPYFDAGGADMMLTTYSVPLYQGEGEAREFMGILTIDLSLDWLQQHVNEIKGYETGYGFLISRTGQIITHPIREYIMNETIFSIADERSFPLLRTIGRSMIRGESSFAEIEYTNVKTGKLSWIAYAPVPLNGWSLGVVFPVDEFMADANRLRLIVSGIGFGGSLFLILIIILISRSITSPLRRLTLVAETIGQGKFDAKLPAIRSKDEIGRLTKAFHNMQDNLVRTIRDLKTAGEELEASHARLEEYNRTLEQKVEERTATLKAAQAQLIQSEKMASLGQLTAGIAHEIKNPLNFVNNFSELSIDLADEILEEIDKLADKEAPGDLGYLKEIVRDIGDNVRKINEHGKRADSIIRGMLLHSRGKSGEMQPTNINTLLAEYVALGYHGMRATDNTFNIKIETDYDPDIGMIRVVPQDLSRVFLNLINNACYSTSLKKKAHKDSYFPILSVSTKRAGDKITVRIRDNGRGIPADIRDKIFNPFFTTKPAGSGTGLGLSISYDIIVHEHKGEIRVESEEGEYAEIIIEIPANL